MAADVEIQRLIQQYKEIERRASKLEVTTEYQQKEIQRIMEFQASNKILTEQVVTRIDRLEENILKQLAQSLTHRTDWIDLIKWVIGGTIIAVIAIVGSMVL